MAAISAAVAAPQTVMTPATAHAASSQPGVPTSLADSAEVMKIPEPIIDPTTIIVASIVPSSRTSGLALRLSGSSFQWSRAGTSSFCATNALTSAIAWSIVSRRQSVSAESSVQASLFTRFDAASFG